MQEQATDTNTIVVTPEDADNISELVVTSSDETLVTVAQDESNPLEFTITSLELPQGETEATVTLTATLGTLTDTCTITIS